MPSTIGKNLQFDLLKGVLSQGTGDKSSAGEAVQALFAQTDEFVQNVVEHKGELENPDTRNEVTTSLDQFKGMLKEGLGQMTDEHLPKTVQDFQGVLLGLMGAGIAVGALKTALALIPPASPSNPAPQPPSPGPGNPCLIGDKASFCGTPAPGAEPPLGGTSVPKAANAQEDVDAAVDEIFAEADGLAEEIAAEKGEFADPAVRQDINQLFSDLQEDLTTMLDGLTPEDLPKQVGEFQMAVLEFMGLGTFVGALKMALGLIPQAEVEPPEAMGKTA